MKNLPPLMLLCWGVGEVWLAKVRKVGKYGDGFRWKRPEPKDTREAAGRSARDAVRKAITLYGKEPRTCRRCGRTWECKRNRAIHLCPQCQTGRGIKVNKSAAFKTKNIGKPTGEHPAGIAALDDLRAAIAETQADSDRIRAGRIARSDPFWNGSD